MKIETVDNHVESSAGFQRHTFNIKAGAKAFMVLSSTLYSNKIRAFVREIICNASDSLPGGAKFNVTLPVPLNPVFSVRDFGTGISEENMYKIYTTYFESTKENDNDNIGGFGLGSKSPFAYTNSFEVISYYANKKYVYTVFLDSSEPNITKVYETETDEPCGLEVNIPINSSDFTTVRDEAIFILQDFKNVSIPQVPNLTHFPEDLMFSLKGYDDGNGYVSRDGFALMGGILYPIPYEYYKDTWFATLCTNGGAAVRFEIGELDIAPSREALSFDETTKANIRQKLIDVSQEDFDNHINKYKDFTSRRAANRELQNNDLLNHAAKAMLREHITVNNQTIKKFLHECSYPSEELNGFKWLDLKKRSTQTITMRTRYGVYVSKVGIDRVVDTYRDHIDVVVCDKSGSVRRFMEQKQVNEAIVCQPGDLDYVQRFLATYFEKDEIRVHYLSSYVPPKKEPTERTQKFHNYYVFKNGKLVSHTDGTVKMFKTLEGNVAFYRGSNLYYDTERPLFYSHYDESQHMPEWLKLNNEDCYLLPYSVMKSTLKNSNLKIVKNNVDEQFDNYCNEIRSACHTMLLYQNPLAYVVNKYGSDEQKKVFGYQYNENDEMAFEYVRKVVKLSGRHFYSSRLVQMKEDFDQMQLAVAKNVLAENPYTALTIKNMTQDQLDTYHKEILMTCKF